MLSIILKMSNCFITEEKGLFEQNWKTTEEKDLSEQSQLNTAAKIYMFIAIFIVILFTDIKTES